MIRSRFSSKEKGALDQEMVKTGRSGNALEPSIRHGGLNISGNAVPFLAGAIASCPNCANERNCHESHDQTVFNRGGTAFITLKLREQVANTGHQFLALIPAK